MHVMDSWCLLFIWKISHMDRSHKALVSLLTTCNWIDTCYFHSPNKQKVITSRQPRLLLAYFKGMFSFLEMDTLQMHKWIPVSSLMGGCQALLRALVSQQISQGNRSENQGKNWDRCGKKILVFNQRCHEDHGRKSMGAENDLSGLTTLSLPAPTCKLKSGVINQTGIKSLFRRDI